MLTMLSCYRSSIPPKTGNGHPGGLNGFILLMYIGAGPGRKEKFYSRLPELISFLKDKGYEFKSVDHLLD